MAVPSPGADTSATTSTHSRSRSRQANTDAHATRAQEALMSNVIVVVGPGLIGQAIARRVGVGKHVLLADLRQDNASAAAEVLGNAGYEVSVATVDASSREAVHALVETATGLGGGHGTDPRGRRVPIAGVPFDDPQSRPVRHSPRAGGVRQHHRLGRCGRRDRLAVGPPPSTAHRRAEQGARHNSRRGATRPPLPSARPG